MRFWTEQIYTQDVLRFVKYEHLIGKKFHEKENSWERYQIEKRRNWSKVECIHSRIINQGSYSKIQIKKEYFCSRRLKMVSCTWDSYNRKIIRPSIGLVERRLHSPWSYIVYFQRKRIWILSFQLAAILVQRGVMFSTFTL